MKLVVSGEEFHFEFGESTVQVLIDKMFEEAEQHELVFSHVTIDGIDVYENIEEYVREHFESIEHIEMKFITVDELVGGILQSTNEYVERAIPELYALSEECYQSPGTTTWGKLQQLIEGIQWLEQTAVFLEKNRDNPLSSQIDTSLFSFSNEVLIMGEAIEGQDFILLGDIIQYEIIPKFESILHNLNNSVREDQAHDFS